jgi:HEAT repeat protein
MEHHRYDVTVSFAGEDRPVVEQFVKLLVEAGYRVFYDAWEQHNLWGKDLYQYLDAIYRQAASYCVVFISENYTRKAWTTHELRSAQARAFDQRSEYILPLRLDDSELPGLPPTTAYFDLRRHSVEEAAALLVKKLRTTEVPSPLNEELRSPDAEKRLQALTLIAVRREENHIDRVIELLRTDPNPKVRECAAWALDNLCDIRAKQALLEALSDPEWGVRSNAGWALVHLGKLAVDEVRRIVEQSPNPDAREMARLVLEFLAVTPTNGDTSQLPERWLTWFRGKL